MISFTPLDTPHFPLLLKWLQAPHVKAWWDSDFEWTSDAITKKYTQYLGENNISAFIIECDKTPIGYIQIYNAYEVEKRKPLADLPKNIDGLDFYIGEPTYLRKGLGPKILTKFIEEKAHSPHILADPDQENSVAIKTYERAGFTKFEELKELGQIMMLRTSDPVALVEFCITSKTPHRPSLYQLCYDQLVTKKSRTSDEDLAYLHSILGIGFSENKATHFEEGLRLAKKIKNVPGKTRFWLHMGLGNSVIREQPSKALVAFSQAREIADTESLSKSLKNLADFKIHSAKFLSSRKKT